MKTASVRDLRFDFSKIERLLRQGEEVEITKRREVIATLVPKRKTERPPMPDFMARLRESFGDTILTPTGAELISQDRDRF